MDVPYCLQASATSRCMRPCRVLRIIHNLDHAATGGPGNWRSRRYERSDWINQRAMVRVASHPRDRNGTREWPISAIWNRFKSQHSGSQRETMALLMLMLMSKDAHQLTWRLHSSFNGAVPIRCCTTAVTAAKPF